MAHQAWRRVVAVPLFLAALLAAGWAPAAAEAATVSATPGRSCQADGRVRAVAVVGDVAYLGGNFTRVWPAGSSASVTRMRLAACRISTGQVLPWAPGANATVVDLAVRQGVVYAVGHFTTAGGAARGRVAAFDATTGALKPWRAEASATVRAIAISGSTVFLGGEFTRVAGATRTRLAAVNADTGRLLSWAPRADATVRDVLLVGGSVVVAGDFRSINGKSARYLRPLDPSTGAVRGWATAASYPTWALATDGRALYAAEGGAGGRLEKFTLAGSRLWSRSADGDCQAVAVLGGTVYVGGHFATFTGLALPRLAAVDAATGTVNRNWAPVPNLGDLGVWTLARSSSGLLVGGDFTKFRSRTQQRFALLPG